MLKSWSVSLSKVLLVLVVMAVGKTKSHPIVIQVAIYQRTVDTLE